MKLKLKYPIKMGAGATEVGELAFREHAVAGDFLAFDQVGPNRQTITLIASLTGTDAALIERLHAADYRAADVIASGLIAVETEGDGEGKPGASSLPAGS